MWVAWQCYNQLVINDFENLELRQEWVIFRTVTKKIRDKQEIGETLLKWGETMPNCSAAEEIFIDW